MEITQSELEFVLSELEGKFMNDFELRSLCDENAELFLPDGTTAAPLVSDKIVSALRQKQPISLLRVGDGEGNAMPIAKGKCSSLHISAFLEKFVSQNGISIAHSEATFMCTELREALLSADIIGFRAFRFDEKAMIRRHVDQQNYNAALGILYARELLYSGLLEGRWRGSVITTAWIHLDITTYLSAILSAASSVLVITGRAELRESFQLRLGERLTAFITVPVQGFIPASLEKSHFGFFPFIKERLNRDLRGTLVLVGAGFFGKIYCCIAKANGAVAIDLGSAFDVLAGLKTRPIHTLYNINAIRWI